jgi:hypothetical protein
MKNKKGEKVTPPSASLMKKVPGAGYIQVRVYSLDTG